ncbi:MAG: hypothetical protein M3322_05900 [Actinomycetota bacterium]|nr:hypothetical protein [Actinomycetota bacterium]
MATTAANARLHAGDDRALVLRSVRLDAALTAAAGLVLAAGTPWLDGALGAPGALLAPLGIFLLGYGAALVMLARVGAPAAGVKGVIAGNASWVVLSVVAVVLDWLTLTTAGTVFALVQAAAVAGLAELQLQALRRASRSAAAAR